MAIHNSRRPSSAVVRSRDMLRMAPALPTPFAPQSFSELQVQLATVGLNLVGLVDVVEFDSAESCEQRVKDRFPFCRAALVVGSGGGEFWSRACAHGPVPVREQCAQVSDQLLDWCRNQGMRAEVVYGDERVRHNMLKLAEQSDLGVVSPVSGWLLHPRYGPWLTLCFVVLLDRLPFGKPAPRTVAAEFQPCASCDQRCVQACPAGANSFGAALQRCAEYRYSGGCADACEMRLACPVGAHYQSGAEAEESYRQQRRLHQLQVEYGLGWWQIVPWVVRRLL